jgi:hypothetical protein
VGFTAMLVSAADWQPAESTLTTPWTQDACPANAHPEHPRPQRVRDPWANLNGLWDDAMRPRDEARPDTLDDQILVPYPVESALSGFADQKNNAKTVVVRPRVRRGGMPGSRATVFGVDVPRAPAQHAPIAGGTARRIGLARLTVIGGVAILAPFPQIEVLIPNVFFSPVDRLL